jgi:molybdopterin biosynthesis enzyme
VVFVIVEKLPINKATGHVLLHNQVGPDGRKVLKKGHRLTEDDLTTLQALGRQEIYVAVLAENDVGENEAAHRLGQVIAGDHIDTSSATTGRVNLVATSAGLFKVNPQDLLVFNDRVGITLATITNNRVVQPKTLVGTIKIIPYGLPRPDLEAAETVARQRAPLVSIKPFVMKQAVLITTGSEAGREKVVTGFTAPLRDRLTSYNVELLPGPYSSENEQEISQALRWALDQDADMILIAGETSIMDADDITPRAIKTMGGRIVHYGMPVEPGNLLLLAYHNQVPIVGAPGCARSNYYNVVDIVLPRLAAGERLSRQDLIELGHGGYLK